MIYYYLVYFSLIESAFHWMMMPEPEVQPEQHHIPIVQELLDSPEYLYADDSRAWLKMKLRLGINAIATTANCTKGQRHNSLWFSVRKLQITASHFGKVLQAIERNMQASFIIIT